MILYHPLNKENEANLKAIEKYKDRLVKIKHGLRDLWFGKEGLVSSEKNAEVLTFKDALKRTKHFTENSRIQYIFQDNYGLEKPNIKDFDAEDVYNCPTIVFDNFQKNSIIK